MIPAIVGKGILLLIGLTASWLDVRYRKLPNWLCALTAVLGLSFAAMDGGLAALGDHSLHMIIALAAGILFFRFRFIGGGDAKFYAGAAAWFGLSQGLGLLLSVAISGGLLFLAWYFWRRITGKRVKVKNPADEDKFPYGVAIAAGACLKYLM